MTTQQFKFVEEQIKPYEAGGRPDSVALLAWFLEADPWAPMDMLQTAGIEAWEILLGKSSQRA